jgi:aspartate racemase
MERYRSDGHPILLIGGGVGPMAGVELHRKIIQQTKTTGLDQDHFDLIHISVSRTIGDRTDFLMGKTSVNPGLKMAAAIGLGLAGLLSDEGRIESPVVVGVPCNTFHAPPIYSAFERELAEWGGRVCPVHMLRETLGLIALRGPKARKIGLMSTTGTRRSRVWHDLLETHGYTVLEVSEEKQELIHETIYHREWGLKAVSPASEQARSRLETFAEDLIADGAEAVILGCTEIPLALPEDSWQEVPLVDPVLALARGMIAAADPERLL